MISQESGDQLLGIPKLATATGSSIAEAVYDLSDEWITLQSYIGMCFDTTSVNTGRLNGACTLLEQKLGRSLLYLACRHHIFELPVAAIFNSMYGPSNGPTIALFDRFKKSWKDIRKNEYELGMNDSFIKNAINDICDDIIKFCLNELKKPIIRHDYQELLQLTIVFLGGPMENYHFRAPGADHYARWMAKLLYAFKILLFKKQFKLKKREERALQLLCIYAIRFHIKAWFRAGNAIEAPYHDYCFLKNIYEFRKVNPDVSSIVIKKFCNHLWYLNGKTIALAFFDSNVPLNEKREMARVLLEYIANPEDDDSPELKRYPLKPNGIEAFCELRLSDFITANTKDFFTQLNIPEAFLSTDPST